MAVVHAGARARTGRGDVSLALAPSVQWRVAETEPWAAVRVIDPAAAAVRLPVHGLRSIVLGRDPDPGDPRKIHHGSVSRVHLEIAWDDASGSYYAHDRGGRNGSWIDGEPLGEDPLPVDDGTVIRIGDVLAEFERGVGVRPDDPSVDPQAIPGRALATGVLRAAIGHAARQDAPVLVTGEAGTEHERVALAIHRLARPDAPFIHLDRALAETMGATLIEAAAIEGGLLFIDEVFTLPLAIQSKLLRLLEAQVPGSRASAVRVVTSTRRDLAADALAGRFRRELHERLAGVEIQVPPLAERAGDVIAWIDVLYDDWQRVRARHGLKLSFEPDAVQALLLSSWRGNVEGLERMVGALAWRRADTTPSERERPITLAELLPFI